MQMPPIFKEIDASFKTAEAIKVKQTVTLKIDVILFILTHFCNKHPIL